MGNEKMINVLMRQAIKKALNVQIAMLHPLLSMTILIRFAFFTISKNIISRAVNGDIYKDRSKIKCGLGILICFGAANFWIPGGKMENQKTKKRSPI